MKKPTEKEYQERVRNLALSFCPRIYTCCKCGNPVVSGFCCSYCNDPNLSEKE